MATKKPGGLTLDEKKGYVRSLGYEFKQGRYPQPKFYLGGDEAEAERRNLRLEQFWRCVEEKWEKGPALQTTFMEDIVLWEKGERAVWNNTLLAAARCVARGESTYFVPRPISSPGNGAQPMLDTEYAHYLADLNREFPVI
ncbi:MAG: hypothetical protein IT429_11195, partial [Gemmataceae bacterium]|nr:hypothetical protein [Gemmataceae bacterium]